MKYKSELIKEIVDSRGHKKSSLHYESECVESWIEVPVVSTGKQTLEEINN